MKKLFTMVALSATVLLVGCETTSGLTPQGETAYFEAQQRAAEKPLFELSCPVEGCVVGNLRVNNPNQRQVNALNTHNPGVELARTALDAAAVMVPWITVGQIARTGIRNAQGDTNVSIRDDRVSSVTEDNSVSTATSDTSLTVDNSQSDSSMTDNSQSDSSTMTDSNNTTQPAE